jgi:hypothetical protein
MVAMCSTLWVDILCDAPNGYGVTGLRIRRFEEEIELLASRVRDRGEGEGEEGVILHL